MTKELLTKGPWRSSGKNSSVIGFTIPCRTLPTGPSDPAPILSSSHERGDRE
jgi:hypothetical protein